MQEDMVWIKKAMISENVYTAHKGLDQPYLFCTDSRPKGSVACDCGRRLCIDQCADWYRKNAISLSGLCG